MHMLITLLFEPIEAYLAHSSLEATAIHGITCCYGHPVTMATEAMHIILLLECKGISNLVYKSFEATIIQSII